MAVWNVVTLGTVWNFWLGLLIMVILVGISNWILSLLAYLGGKSLRIIVDIFGCGAFWPRALAQLEPPSVSNEDVQG